MNTTIKFIAFCFLTLPAINSFSQVNVQKVDKESMLGDKNGLLYSLPRTVIKVDLVVTRTEKQKGPFSAYAQELLGFENGISGYSTEYEIAEIRLSSFQEPNPEEYYFVDFLASKSAKDKQPLHIFLTPSGTLKGISNVPLQSSENQSHVNLTENYGRTNYAEMAIPGMYQKIDTVVKRIVQDTAVIEQLVLNKVSMAKSTDQKAREAADIILKLDQSINNLISGYQEIGYDRETLELMLSKMENLRKSYAELFIGITRKSKLSYSFSYTPSKVDGGKTVILCKFAALKGILDKEAGTGEPFQLVLNPLGTTASVATSVNSRNQMAAGKGLVYQIPEQVNVKVMIGSVSKAEARFPVNQMGVTTYLPATFNGELQFYPETGGIKEILSK